MNELVIRTQLIGLGLLVGLATAMPAESAPFQNLDFEAANVPTTPPPEDSGYGWFVATSDAVPNWTVTVGGAEVTEVMHNNLSLGGSMFTLVGPEWNAIEGNHMVLMQPGLVDDGMTLVPGPVTLSQTALVSANTHSIRFLTSKPWYGDLQLLVDGTPLPLLTLAQQGDVYEMGADMTPYSGGSHEVQFRATTPDGELGSVDLDAILLSEQPVPEPASALLAIAGIIVLFARRKPRASGTA